MGLGCSFVFWGIWKLPNLFVINMFLFFTIFGMIALFLNANHFYGFYKTCRECAFVDDRENCVGLKEVYDNFEKNHLPNIFNFTNGVNEVES